MTTLKPCPMCGSSNTVCEMLVGDAWIRCAHCRIETGMHTTRDEAIASWNTRAAPEVTTEMVEAAQSAMIAFSHAAALAAEPLDVSGCMRAALTAALKAQEK